MSEIQRIPMVNSKPCHPNAKTTTHVNNGVTTTRSNILNPVCRNCQTQTTPLWRRDETGQVLCNACGLFLKLHGRPRPISLKTDTIKLRNRIKQPNFSKSLGPTNPELKLKDVKHALQPKKLLPKMPKRKSPQSLLPDSAGLFNYLTAPLGASTNVNLPLHAARNPAVPHFASLHYAPALPHQVKLLHYPLLTPTQFAPGLQRITSPLLLSTTPSVLNARNGLQQSASLLASPKAALSAAQAAGALENMSNELGPSATFNGQAPATGMSLLSGVLARLESAHSATPLSTLKTSPLLLTLPPILGRVMASPSFGPQYHLLDSAIKPERLEHPRPSLPPVNPGSLNLLPFLGSNVASGATSAVISKVPTPEVHLPPVYSLTGPHQASTGPSQQNQGQGSSGRVPAASGSGSGAAFNGSAPNNQPLDSAGAPADSGSGGRNPDDSRRDKDELYEVASLKMRISELELVNDLYRTRIMELEAMEQAARLRETSMRRRLDDLVAAHGQDQLLSVMSTRKRSAEPEESSKRLKLEDKA